MKKAAYIIRVLTVAPLMALVMLLILFFIKPSFFGNGAVFVLTIVFLVVFPLFAYPLQRFFKKYRDKGRDGQRTLAFIFAVLGYVCGCLLALIFQTPRDILIIFVSYLLSGGIAMLLNRLLHFKASGHACGITGPFTLLAYFGSWVCLIGLPILAIAWISSVYMKRHTHLQLVVGALIPPLALGLVAAVTVIIG
jgi:hypothetical protein